MIYYLNIELLWQCKDVPFSFVFNVSGWTPLHNAANNGEVGLINLLLAHHANVTAPTDDHGQSCSLSVLHHTHPNTISNYTDDKTIDGYDDDNFDVNDKSCIYDNNTVNDDNGNNYKSRNDHIVTIIGLYLILIKVSKKLKLTATLYFL